MAGKPKTAFYLVLVLVVVGLVGFAVWRSEWLFPPEKQPGDGDNGEIALGPEKPDPGRVTTFQEYDWAKRERLAFSRSRAFSHSACRAFFLGSSSSMKSRVS